MYNQAMKIINRFGNARQLAKLIDTDPCNVYRWSYPREKGGTDGLIPTRAMGKVMAAARINGVLLTIEDLTPERILSEKEAAEVDAMMV